MQQPIFDDGTTCRRLAVAFAREPEHLQE